MSDDKNLNVSLNIDAIDGVKKKYKKIKKYMKSNLFQIKMMDGNEKIVSSLLQDDQGKI